MALKFSSTFPFFFSYSRYESDDKIYSGDYNLVATDSWRNLANFTGGLITCRFYELPLGGPGGVLMMGKHLHQKLIKIMLYIPLDYSK